MKNEDLETFFTDMEKNYSKHSDINMVRRVNGNECLMMVREHVIASNIFSSLLLHRELNSLSVFMPFTWNVIVTRTSLIMLLRNG